MKIEPRPRLTVREAEDLLQAYNKRRPKVDLQKKSENLLDFYKSIGLKRTYALEQTEKDRPQLHYEWTRPRPKRRLRRDWRNKRVGTSLPRTKVEEYLDLEPELALSEGNGATSGQTPRSRAPRWKNTSTRSPNPTLPAHTNGGAAPPRTASTTASSPSATAPARSSTQRLPSNALSSPAGPMDQAGATTNHQPTPGVSGRHWRGQSLRCPRPRTTTTMSVSVTSGSLTTTKAQAGSPRRTDRSPSASSRRRPSAPPPLPSTVGGAGWEGPGTS